MKKQKSLSIQQQKNTPLHIYGETKKFTHEWRKKKNLKLIFNKIYLQWTKIWKKLCNEKKIALFFADFRAMCNFLVDMKNIKIVLGSWFGSKFFGIQRNSMFTIFDTPLKKFTTTNFTKKIFFVKSKDLVIILTLSGFGVFYLLMGSVTSDFIWIPLLPFHEKNYFFMKIMPTKFSKKNHIKILRKKQIKTTRVSSAF